MAAAPSPDDFRMSLMEHLGELRVRLGRVVTFVTVLGLFALLFARELYGLLMRPVLLSLPPDAASLVFTSAIEEVNVLMKIGLYAGIFLSTPVLLWQVWGFVAPGLYESERRLAGPFIVFGTLAFLAGALFCYFVLLPSMFTFLLQREDTAALTRRLETARLHEEDALRAFRLGDPSLAAERVRIAAGVLTAPGEGQSGSASFGVTVLPRAQVEARARLAGLGRLVDTLQVAGAAEGRASLAAATTRRGEAIDAFAAGDTARAEALMDEAVTQLVSALPAQAAGVTALWELERLLGAAQARSESLNWTRPMLSMNEQLTLVLVLELAFGLIFELPLVMALLGMVGLVSSSFLFRYQRHAIVLCLIAAAIITPTGDAVNLALMAGPMLACYELGVLLVWLVEKRRARPAPDGAPPQR